MQYTIVDKSHLGGHFNGTAMTFKTLDFVIEKYNIKSIIDIGCGPAGMVEYANFKGVHSQGIDGDTTIGDFPYIKYHDYVEGPLDLNEEYDLAYSTEFLEHVEERFMPNYMPTFQKAKYAFISAAYPGQGGHHHVNEQWPDYWIKKFSEYGFTELPDDLVEIKKTSNDTLITRNSLFFVNNKVVNPSPKEPYPVNYERLKAAANHFTRAVGAHIAGYEEWK